MRSRPGTLAQQYLFTPGTIPNCKVFLDAANRGVTANRWDDLSGNGNHFTSAAGQFPAFASNEATFDGINDFLSAPVNMMNAVAAGEIFIRQKRYADNADAGVNAGWQRFGNDTSLQDHFTYSSTIYSTFGSNARKTVGDPTQNLAAYHTINIWAAANDWSLQINGSVVFATATNTVAWHANGMFGGSTVGAAAPGIFFQGAVKSLAIYSRKLTANERTAVEAYMAAIP